MAYTELYVDPSINADSGTGTIGDPYGDLEYCLEEEDWDATNGIRVNIKAGTDEVVAVEIATAMTSTVSASKSVAWAPSGTAPAVFQGYTAAAGDGGIGGISGGGSVSIYSNTSLDNVSFIDMHLHNTGSAQIVRCNDFFNFINCEISNSTNSDPIRPDNNALFFHCYVHTVSRGLRSQIDLTAINNFIEVSSDTAIFSLSGSGCIIGNIIKVTGNGTGIDLRNGTSVCNNNSIYATSSSTGTGIIINGNSPMLIMNNLVEGFSGAGGVGIDLTDTDAIVHAYGGNAVFDCTTEYSTTGLRTGKEYGDNETLGASPFTSASTDDFSPVDTGNVKEGSLPDLFNEG